MTTKHDQVVVAYDFSPLGQAVLDRAIALVSRAPFHVLHFITVIDSHAGISVLPHKGPIDYQYADRVRDLLGEQIKKAFGTTPISEEIHCFVHTRIGKPAKEILDLGKEVGADLILLGTHGFTGLERLVMGSTAAHVVREAGCPTLVVRPKTWPDVELMKIIEVQTHEPRHAPHRFSYTNNNVVMRPPDWPLY